MPLELLCIGGAMRPITPPGQSGRRGVAPVMLGEPLLIVEGADHQAVR